MPMVFDEGNLDSVNRQGETDWPVGHFVTGPRHSENVAVKWAIHDAYSLAAKPWAACLKATTLAVLISGRFRIDFCRVPMIGFRPVVLSRVGDYVLFGPGIPHKSQSLEDRTRVLTVRWPSIGSDDIMTFDVQQPTEEDLRRLAVAMRSSADEGTDT